MAKDWYGVVVYKILLYLYACLKRRILFDKAVFRKAIGGEAVNEEYLVNIFRMMQEGGLIEGGVFTHAWGDTYILTSEESDFRITAAGIEYLEENDKMKKIGHFLMDRMDFIAGLISLV